MSDDEKRALIAKLREQFHAVCHLQRDGEMDTLLVDNGLSLEVSTLNLDIHIDYSHQYAAKPLHPVGLVSPEHILLRTYDPIAMIFWALTWQMKHEMYKCLAD